jgi:hypothetical protein
MKFLNRILNKFNPKLVIVTGSYFLLLTKKRYHKQDSLGEWVAASIIAVKLLLPPNLDQSCFYDERSIFLYVPEHPPKLCIGRNQLNDNLLGLTPLTQWY